MYESHDSGDSWLRLAQIGKRDDLVLDSIVVDARNPRHLIVGAWVVGNNDDGGIFVSDDGGATWTNQAEMRGQSVRALAASASEPKILVAGSLQGVFRSTDGGRRWQRISPADAGGLHEFASVAIDPKDPDVIYAGTWHLPWKTTDGGEHWDNIKEGIIDDSDVFSIIVDPTSPQTVYASACSGIYKSENAGGVFRKVQGIPSTARRTRVLLQDPHNLDRVFAGTTEGLFRSDDAGKTWSRTTGPEIIVNDVSVNLEHPQRVLLATDRGGVLASDDGGDTFHPSNRGFSARQVTTLARDANRRSTLFVGVVNDKDWGGVFESTNGGVNWMQRSDGLQGRDVFALDQAPDGTMLAGTIHGIFRLDGSSETWQRVEGMPEGLSAAQPVRPAPIVTRPPVPIAHKRVAVHRPATGAKRNAAQHNVKHTVPAKAKTKPAAAPAAATKKRAVGGKRAVSGKGPAPRQSLAQTSAPAGVAATAPVGIAVQPAVFDGGVYVMVTTERLVLAATSAGLLSSSDNGQTWASAGPKSSTEWRFLASAKQNVVAGSLHSISFSPDSGVTWAPIKLPAELTQVSAVAVEPSGEIWVGGREGLFISSDGGNVWSTPKNLFVSSVTSIYYDELANAVTVTTAGPQGVVFTMKLPQRSVAYYESGWTLRFARPVDDHLVAATLFDGIVMQPRMMASPLPKAGAAASDSTAAVPASPPARQ